MLLLLFSLLLSDVQAAETQLFISNDKPKQLIELYTSEGCSSCPPAEKWLNGFVHQPKVFDSVFPMAFHVDYWDYLGWDDPYAKKSYSNRQYQHYRDGDIVQVYTPGVLSNGKEWRHWRVFGDLNAINARQPEGELKLSIQHNQALLNYSKAGSGKRYHLVVLGFDISTEVESGENTGRRLEHEFVVLHHEEQASAQANLQFEIPDLEKRKMALVAWVNDHDDSTPLQIVGGWLSP